jgi:uncharacterized membrane protein
MTLAPLLNASPVIQAHACLAFAAIGLGALQMALPKGALPHRGAGWIWATLMIAVAATSLFIHTIRLWGPWSPIHLLSLLVLVTVPLGVWRARRGDIDSHRKTMTALFVLALLVTGLFTLLPGRIMNAVVFGG